MGDTTAEGTRCPRCSAAVRAGAPWCTQCYARAGAGTPAGGHEAGPASAGALCVAERAPDTPVLRASTATWPCGACPQHNDLAVASCEACGTPFLAAVRDERPTVVLPGVGDLLALSPLRRVGLAVCVVLAFLLVCSALALLLA